MIDRRTCNRSCEDQRSVHHDLRVATSEGVGTGKSDNFLVIKAHAIKDSAQVIRVALIGSFWTTVGVGKTSIGSYGGRIQGIDSTGTPGNGRASHGLDRSD